jgi:hypothetical protein
MLHHILARGRSEGKDLIEKLRLVRGVGGKGEATNYEFRSLALFFLKKTVGDGNYGCYHLSLNQHKTISCWIGKATFIH